MKVMGLRGGVNFFAWFINTMAGMAIMAVVVVVFLKFGGLMRYSDVVILYLYLLDFSFSTTMMW